MSSPLIREIEVKGVITKSNLPVCEYSVNPYVGCTHGCRYCYASFMKRFTGHTEPWGAFLDVKNWPEIKNPKKYAGKELFIGSVTDPYLPQEEKYPALLPLYREIYQKGSRSYWERLDERLRAYAAETGLAYVTNDDSMKRPFEAPPVIVNYFYHEQVRKRAARAGGLPGRA